jgi:hypothetical protein
VHGEGLVHLEGEAGGRHERVREDVQRVLAHGAPHGALHLRREPRLAGEGEQRAHLRASVQDGSHTHTHTHQIHAPPLPLAQTWLCEQE